jgi:hypothetical protein
MEPAAWGGRERKMRLIQKSQNFSAVTAWTEASWLIAAANQDHGGGAHLPAVNWRLEAIPDYPFLRLQRALFKIGKSPMEARRR